MPLIRSPGGPNVQITNDGLEDSEVVRQEETGMTTRTVTRGRKKQAGQRQVDLTNQFAEPGVNPHIESMVSEHQVNLMIRNSLEQFRCEISESVGMELRNIMSEINLNANTAHRVDGRSSNVANQSDSQERLGIAP